MRKISLQFIRNKNVLVYISIFEFMVIGLLVSFIENGYRLIVEAPTVGLTMFCIGLVVLLLSWARTHQ